MQPPANVRPDPPAPAIADVQHLPAYKKTIYVSRRIKKGLWEGGERTRHNWNGEITISAPGRVGDDATILCEDLALAHAKSGNQVIDLHFQTEEGVRSYFENQPFAHDEYVALCRNNGSRRIVYNKQFGSFLSDVIGQMTVQNLSRCGIVVSTSGHAFSCFIQIKPEDDKEARFTLDFVDPNDMGRPRRIELPMGGRDPLSGLRGHELAQCFGRWRHHVPEDRPNDATWCLAVPVRDIGLPPSTQLQYLPPPGQWDLRETVAAALLGNLPGLLYQAGEEMARRATPGADVRQFLAQNDKNGAGLLHRAMQDGFDGMVTACGRVMQKLGIPREQAARILEARDADGVPVLNLTAQNGHAGVFKAVGEQLRAFRVSPELAATILEAKREDDGVPALAMAAQCGHAGVITELARQLKACQVPDRRAQEILAAKSADGVSALLAAAHEGHADIIKALAEQFRTFKVSPEQAATLLEARSPDGSTAICVAAASGHRTVISTIANISKEIGISHPRAAMLMFPQDTKYSPLYLAATYGHAHVVEEFANSLDLLSLDPVFALRSIHGAGPDGLSPRQLAVRRNDLVFVRALDRLRDALRRQ